MDACLRSFISIVTHNSTCLQTMNVLSSFNARCLVRVVSSAVRGLCAQHQTGFSVYNLARLCAYVRCYEPLLRRDHPVIKVRLRCISC